MHGDDIVGCCSVAQFWIWLNL